MKALVVFHDHGSHVLSPLLKRGFRHCFAAVSNGEYWITIDGGEGFPLIEVAAPSDFDLAAHYRKQGFGVIETEQGSTLPSSPLVLANCVGIVTTVLCIRSWAVTPYGLYKYLRRAS